MCDKNKDIKMTSRFLASVTEIIEVLLTEIGKNENGTCL